ncbi:hypothetical protein HQ529_04135 [Candidatus Woesearchaeota archaeon]|nr:hypothetical protein [Candidatus Woesearchaeota archaeon]
MKKENNIENILLIGVLILLLGGLVFSITGFSVKEPTDKKETIKLQENSKPIETNKYNKIVTGSTENGEVSIELMPHEVENNKLVVDIWVNTHSVDLSMFDLKEITTLEYNGKSVSPVSALGLGGHHVSGTLVFDVDDKIESFTIKIKGIPKVEERVFEWSE